MPECTVCRSPLGAESIDLGYQVCHTHRVCARCNKAASATEVDYCLRHNTAVYHARCMVVTGPMTEIKRDPIAFVELMNMVHLLAQSPVLLGNDLATQSFDAKFQFLQDLQHCAAETSVLIRRDKAAYESSMADRHHHKKQGAKHQVEAQTNSLPSVKTKNTKMDKFVNSMTKLGIDRPTAEKLWMDRQAGVQ